MEKVKLRPIDEQDPHDVHIRSPQLEQIVFPDHAASQPQPPRYEQASPFAL